MENEVRNPAESSSIGQMVEQIMKNPELTGIINELRGASDGTPAVSQAEILSHLPDVMAMLKPMVGDTSGPPPEKRESAAESTEAPAPEETAKAVSAAVPKKYDRNRAEKLMAALKPYLNETRCDIIDKCVSVLQITDVVGAMQGLEGLTKPRT